jgi:outer membrane biosynthesis protein TonB
VAVLIAVFAAPARPVRELTIQEMPERLARLILEKPKPVPAVKAPAASLPQEAAPEVAQVAPQKTETAQPKAEAVRPVVRPVRRQPAPEVAADKGKQGREKARTEVAQNLSQVSGSLDKVLGELSQALPTSANSDGPAPRTRGRQRGSVRSGRATTQLEAVNLTTDVATADVQGSALAGSGISIAAITDLQTGGTEAGSMGSAAAGTGPDNGGGEIRSNQALLAVVRRYAPGIQFCYENELKKSPGLRGKLVVSLTVEPDGRVSNVVLVEDTLRSAAVTDCVLAQMQGWKFPTIEQGIVSFKTPFVFTPPE